MNVAKTHKNQMRKGLLSSAFCICISQRRSLYLGLDRRAYPSSDDRSGRDTLSTSHRSKTVGLAENIAWVESESGTREKYYWITDQGRNSNQPSSANLVRIGQLHHNHQLPELNHEIARKKNLTATDQQARKRLRI